MKRIFMGRTMFNVNVGRNLVRPKEEDRKRSGDSVSYGSINIGRKIAMCWLERRVLGGHQVSTCNE